MGPVAVEQPGSEKMADVVVARAAVTAESMAVAPWADEEREAGEGMEREAVVETVASVHRM